MPHEVIMPALGMAQDRGIIVSWLKQPGDAVKAGDALFEVETDKATMEVEAAADGFLTDVSVAAGEEVPVGNVIARISEAAEAIAAPLVAKETPAVAGPEAAGVIPHTPPPVASVPKVPARDAAVNEQRVLATPKARRLALERNIDLQNLVSIGYRQPIRSADLAGLPAPHPAPPAHSVGQPLRLAAEVDAAQFTKFLHWMEEESGRAPDRAAVLAAFVGGALRSLMPSQQLSVSVQHQSAVRTFIDPDLAPFGEIEESDGVPGVLLHDLAGTKLTSVTLGAGTQPVVTLTGAEILTLTLEASHDLLPPTQALQFLAGLAERIAEPLRQLL